MTVLDPDTVDDSIETTYGGVKVLDNVEIESRENNIARFKEEFESTLTKVPGFCDKVQFGIDMEQHKPPIQHTCGT